MDGGTEEVSKSIMIFNVSILSEAEADIDKAFVWYELRQLKLGYKFYKTIEESVKDISRNPFICEEKYKGIRRFIMKKYPYGIYYKIDIENKEIQIIAVIHFSRSIRVIKKRL